MKKIVSILLILCMIFALGACNGSSSDSEKTTILNPDIKPMSIDEGTITAYLDNCAYFGRCNWNDFTTEEQRAISEKAAKAQIELNVSDDGVIKIIDLSGIIIEYGGAWPSENALVQNFPVPDEKVAYVYTQAGVLCYVATYMTRDEAKEYTKNFAPLGFDKEVTEAEGEKTYYYDAENGSGRMAFIVYEAGITMFGVMPVKAQ